ncbi:MAG: hypothetical protein WD875_12030 [Pirellulales bacterium]
MELRWRPSFSASCTHAISVSVTGGQFVDENLSAALAPAMLELAEPLVAVRSVLPTFLEHLCALSVELEGNRQLADVALTKSLGRGRSATHVESLTRAIDGVEAAMSAARPKLAADLQLRVGPLRAAWEARGPGLLRIVGQVTSAELLVERADVILVEPLESGGGAAHPPYNSVRIEAVLTNADDRLPEVLRLAWLLSQLQFELPMYSEHLSPHRRREVCRLSMLPALLAAAEQVELARLNAETLALAIERWRIWSERDATDIAATLLTWWNIYSDARPSWPVALGALDRMLEDAASDEHAGAAALSSAQ